VDVVEPFVPRDGEVGRRLMPDATGPLTLPLWPDHVAGVKTRWGRFRLDEQRRVIDGAVGGEAFVSIEPL